MATRTPPITSLSHRFILRHAAPTISVLNAPLHKALVLDALSVQISPLLPANYALTPTPAVIQGYPLEIVGYDLPGLGLDDYVLPRLHAAGFSATRVFEPAALFAPRPAIHTHSRSRGGKPRFLRSTSLPVPIEPQSDH